MTTRLSPTVLAAVLIVCAAGRAGAITYTSLDHPLAGRGGTVAYDIDGSRIVGAYFDAAGASHAFVYDNSIWSTLDHPNAAAPRGTAAYGVSNGLITGTYVEPSGQTFGYLYDGSNWTTLSYPAGATGRVDTFARGVSGGTVVGYYIDSLATRGFIYEGGTFRDLVVPGATGTFPEDVDAGRIVGTFDNAAGTHGFLLEGGMVRTIDHPLGTILGTYVTGIDGANIVGSYLSILDGSSHGFLYDSSRFTAIDYPGAADTTVNGIDGDRVVGSYVDTAGNVHGFIAVIPEPAALAWAGPGVLLACRRRRRRVSPQG